MPTEHLDRLFRDFESYRVSHAPSGTPESLYAPMDYILSLGGKRLRPILTLAACEAFGGDSQRALAPALGIEVFHNFSLVHDDIMDQAPLRRASETVHMKWDINTAILSGDALLVEAYRLIAQVDAEVLPYVLDRFTQTARRLCEGQQLDMEFEQRSKVEEAQYLEMIEGKTSVLIGCALAVGARIGGADNDSANAMYDFGRKLGLAFQIMDDHLDCFGDPGKTGKQEGGDILAGKHTLLAIHCRNQDPQAFKEMSKRTGREKVQGMKQLYVQTATDTYALEKSEALLAESIADLRKALDEGPQRQALEELAKSLVHRSF